MKKPKFVLILALLVVMLVVGCQKQENPPPPNIGPEAKLVCLFFDDCWQNQYDVALPILVEHDFKATFGVVTGSIGNGHDFYQYMGEEQLEELAKYGMDIACHTRTHANLTANLTDEQLVEEITESKRHLEELGFQVRTFVYPHYEWNDTIVDYVKEAGYVCARSGGHIQRKPYDLKTIDPDSRYHFGSIPITSQSFDEFKRVVAKADRYSVVSLCYHFISDTTQVQTSVPIQNFSDQMSYLKEAGFTVVLLPDLIEYLPEAITQN
ncbi:MAG: polysaccharide deacetylase family protein [Dehalococcoidia bacterium]|nr:polysaccharide deacetylase family protein [Dehalococcoidia bacterium]